MDFIVCTSFVFVLFIQESSGAPKCVNNANKSLDDAIGCIQHEYDKVQMPNRTDGEPLRVSVDIVVISIGSLNDIEMDYTLEFYMRQRWIDPLLGYDAAILGKNASYATLDQNLIENLWRPDTYIENMKSLKVNFAVGPFVNQGFRLYPNGLLVISSRISATLSCAMDFHSFPMDKQLCEISLSSYFFTESVLFYEWGEVTIYEGSEQNNQFDVLGVESTRQSLIYSSGVYSSLKAEFKFRRRIQTFMLSFYIPSILTVMLSWVSFYISPNSAPARCALGIITVLAIGGFLTGQRSSFPVVSYVMAADLFILVCYVFAFLALLEYAAVHYFFVYEMQLYRMNQNKNESLNNQHCVIIDEGEYDPDEDEEKTMRETKLPEPVTIVHPANNKVAPFPVIKAEQLRKKKSFCKYVREVLTSPYKLYQVVKNDALIIDKVSRVVFPLSFALFNVFYWSIYKLEHNNRDVYR